MHVSQDKTCQNGSCYMFSLQNLFHFFVANLWSLGSGSIFYELYFSRSSNFVGIVFPLFVSIYQHIILTDPSSKVMLFSKFKHFLSLNWSNVSSFSLSFSVTQSEAVILQKNKRMNSSFQILIKACLINISKKKKLFFILL